jgi:MFS family permease
MELYKSRGFGEFFQDTFAFLKQSGKHLFKQFFIVNGIFLIILMVLGYFFSKFYTDIVFGGLMSNNPSVVDDYMNENMGIFIVLIILFCTVGLIAGVVSYSFVPIYLKLHSERGGSNFETRDIVDLYKKHIGKIFIFLVCAILVSIPLMIVCGVAMFLLVITIIGMLLLPLVIGFVALFYQSTLIEYIEDKKGIWECFGYAWTLISSKFWAAIGSVGIFFLMSYIVQNIIALIPYIFGMASLFTTIEQGDTMNNPQEIAGTMTVMMIAIFLLTFLVSSILNVIVQLNQGIVFYSLKEDNENINTKSVIDQIGSGE